MSTNYYLINKEQNQKRENANIFLFEKTKELQDSLLKYYKENDLEDYVEETILKSEIRRLEYNIANMNSYIESEYFLGKVFGSASGLRFVKSNEIRIIEDEEVNLSSINSISNFIQKYEDKYEIRDEYNRVIELEEFQGIYQYK